MRIRYWLAAAALTAAAAAGVTAGPARAATPSCGPDCIDLYNVPLGNGYVMDVFRQHQTAGTPVILFRASNSDPAQDWTVTEQGPVSQFYRAGLVSSQVALHYGCLPRRHQPCDGAEDYAYELEYAPFGADSGLCAGVAVTAGQGTQVSLQPCGVSAKTVWIADSYDTTLTAGRVPAINGSDTNFSHPYVLTYTGDPGSQPRPQLYTSQLTGFSNGSGGPELGTIDDSQLWYATFGVLP